MLPLRPTPQPTNRRGAGCEVPRFTGNDGAPHTAFSPKFAHLCRYLTSGARGCSGVARSGGPPYPGPIWPRFGPIHSQWRGSRWGQCDLVRSACTRERGRESLRWPWLASSRVARRGELLFRLHLVAFRCFSHPPNPHPRLLPEGDGTCRGRGCEVPAFAGTTDTFAEMTYANNVAISGAMAQWAFVVGCGVASRMRRAGRAHDYVLCHATRLMPYNARRYALV